MFRTQSTPNFSVAEHYGLWNTSCVYSKDAGSEVAFLIVAGALAGTYF
jgi:hypothetical protein